MSLQLITAYQENQKRDYQVIASKRSRLNPSDANALEAGEFAALATGDAEREMADLGVITGTIGTGVTGATLPTNETSLYQVFTERGRYDVQAIDKVTVLWGRPYEAETNVFDNTGGISVGQPLTVKVGTKASVLNRLVLRPAAVGDVVFGWALVALSASPDPLGSSVLAFRFEGPLFVAA
jgi:hypothetical protein